MTKISEILTARYRKTERYKLFITIKQVIYRLTSVFFVSEDITANIQRTRSSSCDAVLQIREMFGQDRCGSGVSGSLFEFRSSEVAKVDTGSWEFWGIRCRTEGEFSGAPGQPGFRVGGVPFGRICNKKSRRNL